MNQPNMLDCYLVLEFSSTHTANMSSPLASVIKAGFNPSALYSVNNASIAAFALH